VVYKERAYPTPGKSVRGEKAPHNKILLKIRHIFASGTEIIKHAVALSFPSGIRLGLEG
jgi:hypothetical protein